MKKISLALNVICILFFVWYFFFHVGIRAYYDKYVSKNELFLNNRYYKERVKVYEEMNKRLNPHIKYNVFIGDSLIEQFPVREIFRNKNVLNRGILLDSTVGILKRLDSNVNNINMARCFLLIGHNDLEHRTPEKIYENISTILSEIKAKRKYFISIPPCDNTKLNAQIEKINKLIESSSRTGSFEYIDIYSLFIGKNGKLKRENFYDDIHLNISGYLKMEETLNFYMNN